MSTFDAMSRVSVPSLSYTQSGPTEGRRVWVLHGIMGSKQNWSRFVRHLSMRYPALSITSVDLRCHGLTPHFVGPHTVADCAADLDRLGVQIGYPQAIIGHSFGGKVALHYAADRSREGDLKGLDRVWTLDSPLSAQPQPGHSEVSRVIAACAELPTPQPTRQAVTEYFTARGFSLGIAQWMTTNLRRLTRDESAEGGFTWRFDLSGISELIKSYWQVDGWSLLSEINSDVRLHLLRAERGMRWSQEDAERIAREAPHVNTPLLADSGHWVHIDQLEALIELMWEL